MDKLPKRRSITATIAIVLALLGLIPFLTSIYLFVFTGASLSQLVTFLAAMTLMCILCGYSLLRNTSSKLVELSQKTNEIMENGSIEQIAIEGESEIMQIAENFSSMAGSLNQAQKDIKDQSIQLIRYTTDLAKSYQKIREETELRGLLSQYVGQNLVNELVKTKGKAFSGTNRAEVTVLFADIRSFTTIAEKLPADEVVTMLNEFFSAMVDFIFRNHGILDKFVGDQIMAVFGIIEPDSRNSALDAVKTAVEMQTAIKALMAERRRQGQETFEIGIGINTGNVVVGNIGSENRKNYTVIGDCVNVADRLQELTDGGEVAVGESTYRYTQDRYSFQEQDHLQVKNRTEPVLWYKLRSLDPIP